MRNELIAYILDHLPVIIAAMRDRLSWAPSTSRGIDDGRSRDTLTIVDGPARS
jgi:hypothetical protein